MLLFFYSCAQIQKKPEFVAIDSNPRGLKVLKFEDEKAKADYLGKTPLIDEDHYGSEATYKIEYRQRGRKKLTTKMGKVEKCGVLWNEPIFKDVPIIKETIKDDGSLISKINPLTYMKGGKYDCSTKISFDAPKGTRGISEKDQCGTFLIIPPKNKYQHVSDRLMQDWINKVFQKRKRKCDKLVKPDKAKDLLNFLGYHHLSKTEYGLRHQMYGKIAQLGNKMNASHLVFLHYEKKKDTFYTYPKVYDIFRLKRNRPKLERTIKRDLVVDDEFNFFNKLEDAVQLFPNSFALKFATNERLHLEPESAESNYPTQRNFTFPPTIRLKNVYYPLQKFGINYSFTPEVDITGWNDTIELDFYALSLSFNIFAHTPLGTITGYYAVGYSHIDAEYRRSGQDTITDSTFTPITQWGLEYYLFLTERYYVNVGYMRSQIRLNEIRVDNFNLKEISSFFFSLGIYAPEVQLKIKNWFN